MAKCKTCGKKFHACTNCSFCNDWEWDYCSHKCWKNSEEYKINNILINSFVVSLNEPQLKAFREITSLNDDYFFVIAEAIKKFEK